MGPIRICAACGHHPACGQASITGPDGVERWYCHADPNCHDSPLTCYEQLGATEMQLAAIAAADLDDAVDDVRQGVTRLADLLKRATARAGDADEVARLRRLVGRATSFEFNRNPTIDPIDAWSSQFTVEHRGGMTTDEDDNWAICLRGHRVLTRDGVWDWEPIPSERTDEWRATCRFPFVQAIAIAERIEAGLGIGRRLVNLTVDEAAAVDEIVRTATAEALVEFPAPTPTEPTPEPDVLDVWRFDYDRKTGRPIPPHMQDDFDELTGDERSRLNAAYRLLVTDWMIGSLGCRRVDTYEDGALRFCGECFAGGSELGEPVNGLDSHGDCAGDGETVYWMVPA